MRPQQPYELYDLMVEQPRPLAPRWLRFDVPERRVSRNRRADVDHALVLDGHEGRTDLHDELFDGRFSAGPIEGGGFRVFASLPRGSRLETASRS